MKRFLVLGAAIAAMAMLEGCAGTQLSVDNFANATVAQLQTADKIALAQTPPDLAASTCYEGMQPAVVSLQQTLDQQAQGAAGFSAVPGPVDFQVVRDATKAGLNGTAGGGPLLDAFNKSCGWLKADVEKDVVTIGVRLAPLGIKLPL